MLNRGDFMKRPGKLNFHHNHVRRSSHFYRSPYNTRYWIRVFRVFIVLVIVCVTGLLFEMKIRPTVETMSTNQADIICTQAIHSAVANELEENQSKYHDLVAIRQDAQGNIIAIETNATAVNNLKSNITNKLTDSLQNGSTDDLSIPLGTLLNSQFFTGRGLNIPFKIVPTSTAATNLISKFSTAGINQTLHQINLTVDIDVEAILPGVSSPTHIHTSFLIAETVIVGKVPEAFTHVNGDDSSLPGKIFDYGAALS